MGQDDKIKALEAAITKIEKDFGKGAIMKLGDSGNHMNVETVPTGSLSLDVALGLGGVPKGRIVEIYGPESSGKTTVALHMVAEVQKRGGIAGFIDAEHAGPVLRCKQCIHGMPECTERGCDKSIWNKRGIGICVQQSGQGASCFAFGQNDRTQH